MAHQVSEQHAVLAVSGPEVTLSPRRFSIREGLNELFSVRVIANSPDNAIDLEEIVGRAALFQLSGGQLHAQYGTRRWTGIIAHAEQVHVSEKQRGSETPGESTYYFHLVPAFWLTTQRRETRIFQHTKIPYIIRTILKEWGIESINELNGFYREHDYIVQYDETDYAFIKRLCEWAGINFYFKFQVLDKDGWERGTKDKPRSEGELSNESEAAKARREREEERDRENRKADANMHAGWTTINEPGEPDDATHEDDKQLDPSAAVPLKLAFSDGVHENEPRALPIHYVEEPNEAAQEEFVTECRLEYNVAPGHHVIRDFDYRGKLDYDLSTSEKEKAERPEDFYEQYHYMPGAFEAVMDTPELDVGDKPDGYKHLQKEVGEEMAQRRFHADRYNRSRIRFVTNCVDLGPGVVFTINHHPRADLDLKKYLVRKFTLEGTVNDKWTYEGEAQFQSEPCYPQLTVPKPRIRGLQSAIVTGPKGGEEIHCDELGRVKVQFIWDRDGVYDDSSSCWVRVSHDWAGTGFGTQYIPRVGQEVLVAFLEGDPDLPIIVGRNYNGINKVPYELPVFKERSTWKTDSTPKADGFSEITFEDLNEKEKIFIQSETDTQKLVKQFETHRIGNNHMTVVGESRTSVVSKLDALMVGERYSLRSIKPPKVNRNDKGKLDKGGDLKIPELGHPSIEPLKTAIELKDKRVVFTTGQATLSFEDDNVRMEAAGNITVKAKGGDCIIEGVKVHLNPSKAPGAQSHKSFKLPDHDGWDFHAADALKDLKQEALKREKGIARLKPPKPDFVSDEMPELHKCFLMATLIHCMHPDSPREPCQDEDDDDFHRLYIVPDAPELGSRMPGMEGEGQRGSAHAGKPDVLVRPKDDDDPRQRYNKWGKKDDKGGFVKKHGDYITLKSKVNDKCGNHTRWRVTGFDDGAHTADGKEDWFVEIPGWIAYPKLDNIDITTADIESVISAKTKKERDAENDEISEATGYSDAKDKFTKAEEAYEKDPTDDNEHKRDTAKIERDKKKEAYDELKKEPWKFPVQARIKGLAWAARATPKAYHVTAAACSGPPHKYQILTYPSDSFSIDIGFGKGQFFEPFDSWLKHGFGERGKISTFLGEFKAGINCNVYIGGNAKWAEYNRDHRAFYQYQLKISFEPLISVSAEFAIHLYNALGWFGPWGMAAGKALKAVSHWFDAALKFKATGEIKGEMTWTRKGPDDLSVEHGGSMTGVLTLAVTLDVFAVKKEIVGAGAGGKTNFIIAAKPKKDKLPIDPAVLEVSGEWKGFTVSVYANVKAVVRFSKSWEVAKPKKWGPKDVKPMSWVNGFLRRQYREL